MTVALQDNIGDNFTAAANGAFTSVTKAVNGSTYSVTVPTQPSASQSYSVASGTGTIAANLTIVLIIPLCCTRQVSARTEIQCRMKQSLGSVSLLSNAVFVTLLYS
jgi:hypothetical protein